VPSGQETSSKPPAMSFWRRIGGGSLSFSLLFHSILLGIAVVWVLKSVPSEQPAPDFLPQSGGGGTSQKAQTEQMKRKAMMPSGASRVAAQGMESGFTLPEPEQSRLMDSVGVLGSGGL